MVINDLNDAYTILVQGLTRMVKVVEQNGTQMIEQRDDRHPVTEHPPKQPNS